MSRVLDPNKLALAAQLCPAGVKRYALWLARRVTQDRDAIPALGRIVDALEVRVGPHPTLRGIVQAIARRCA